jgi:hypothetical protein
MVKILRWRKQVARLQRTQRPPSGVANSREQTEQRHGIELTPTFDSDLIGNLHVDAYRFRQRGWANCPVELFGKSVSQFVNLPDVGVTTSDQNFHIHQARKSSPTSVQNSIVRLPVPRSQPNTARFLIQCPIRCAAFSCPATTICTDPGRTGRTVAARSHCGLRA